jgi:crotonobetainyl-CoA:carnitine CoA-transferase CaiB-like acyl-CoA transferase
MLDSSIYFNWPDLMWNESFIGDGVQYSGDLADQYGVSGTADGAIVSHRLNGSVKDYDTETLLTLFAEHEIPAARVNSRADIRDDPQIIAQKTLRQVEHPLAGTLLQPRPPARFGSDEFFPEDTSPSLGDHTDKVLTELGYDQSAIGSLRASGAIG